MSHLSSDQRPTSSVFAVQRNGILILQASPWRRGFAAWVARLIALSIAAALVTGCGTASPSAPPTRPCNYLSKPLARRGRLARPRRCRHSHGSLLPTVVDLPANHSHDQRPTSLYDQPSLSTADPESISR